MPSLPASRRIVRYFNSAYSDLAAMKDGNVLIGVSPTDCFYGCYRDRATTTCNLLDFNGIDSPFLIL